MTESSFAETRRVGPDPTGHIEVPYLRVVGTGVTVSNITVTGLPSWREFASMKLRGVRRAIRRAVTR